METIEVLRAARAGWPTTDSWVQYVFAVDAQSRSCPSDHEDAVAWCVIGRVTSVGDGRAVDDALTALEDALGGVLADWNDAEGRTVEEVADLFDRAIAMEER